MAQPVRSSQTFPDLDSQTLKHRRVVRLKFIPLLDWHRAIPRSYENYTHQLLEKFVRAPIYTATTCVSSPHRSSTNTNRRSLMYEFYSLPTEQKAWSRRWLSDLTPARSAR